VTGAAEFHQYGFDDIGVAAVVMNKGVMYLAGLRPVNQVK